MKRYNRTRYSGLSCIDPGRQRWHWTYRKAYPSRRRPAGRAPRPCVLLYLATAGDARLHGRHQGSGPLSPAVSGGSSRPAWVPGPTGPTAPRRDHRGFPYGRIMAWGLRVYLRRGACQLTVGPPGLPPCRTMRLRAAAGRRTPDQSSHHLPESTLGLALAPGPPGRNAGSTLAWSRAHCASGIRMPPNAF